jgi:hypothetical protein
MREPRRVRRIGPLLRPLIARSTARLTAGGSGTSLVALAAHSEYPVAVFLAEVADVSAGRFKDP